MAATVFFPIEAHPVQERTGELCDRCFSPTLTVIAIDLVRFTDEAIHDLGRYEASECQSCGASDITR
jgi:hypothetical protein